MELNTLNKIPTVFTCDPSEKTNGNLFETCINENKLREMLNKLNYSKPL